MKKVNVTNNLACINNNNRKRSVLGTIIHPFMFFT